jgi:Reverse transcriptase (RNA-dependent DNA polymerase)
MMPPAGRRVIASKWVFKAKPAADGSIARYKARLVAKGFSQLEGIDFNQTFAPVAQLTSFRVALALAAHHGWQLRHWQLDVQTAFIQSPDGVTEELYVAAPPGRELAAADGTPLPVVLLLHRSLYGLRQSSRNWHRALAEQLPVALLPVDFIATAADACVFIHHTSRLIIIVYVDDITDSS